MSSNIYNNNIVYPSKMELVDMLQNMSLNGDIMLEPRLQEYIKKKLFYKNNAIDPCISPEKEYLITSMDKKVLRDFMAGKKNIYNKHYDKYESSKERKQQFPSSKFREDSRVPDIEKLKPSTTVPPNRGMFVPDKNQHYYEEPVSQENKIMDARDFPKMVYTGNGFDMNENKFNPRIDSQIDPGFEKFDKYQSQFRIPPTPLSTPDPDPRNKYIISDLSKQQRRPRKQPHGDYIPDDHTKFYGDYDNMNSYKNYQLMNDYDKNISRNQDRYGNELTPSFNAASEMDLDNKVVIPNVASNSKKDLSIGNYRFETYYGQSANRDTTLENDLVRGMPSSRPHNRSYGYRNPVENYFDFIDDDFQSPDTSVEAWERGGTATRLDNKNPAKNRVYNRVIM